MKETTRCHLNIFDSYLYETEEYIVTTGVPQGSVLSPFLWNFMYDNLVKPKRWLADDLAIALTTKTT